MKKRTLVISIVSILALAVIILLTPLGTPIASAVQNIFMGLNTVKDIKYRGKNVNKVVYRGQVVWEREPEAPSGTHMQTITSANCPTNRTRVVDARDGHSYWVQQLADGRCWMLTNLAYAGAGNNMYGDVKSITNSNAEIYTAPYYTIPPEANPTTEPTDPSTSTDGGATNPQYGYLYNWCAAMGAQTGTSACANATTPAPNLGISICPVGWRLPTGDGGGEYHILNNAINSGSSTSPVGLLSTWLLQYGGAWRNGNLVDVGNYGIYWSSRQYDTSSIRIATFSNSFVSPANARGGFFKLYLLAVRCIAD